MALLGVEPWAAAWEIVALLTDPLVGLLQQIEPLSQPFANRLTAAELLAFIVVAFAGLTYLASISLRDE